MIHGYLGDDVMTGGAGNDILYVNSLNDIVNEAAGEGFDMVASSISYMLDGGAHIEYLRTTSNRGTNALNLTGNGFGQIVMGNDGANTLDGAGGGDTLRGLAGNDIYLVRDSGDRVLETVGGGADEVHADVSFALEAGQEIEVLRTDNHAGTAARNLTGNEFAQEIIGNAGANLLRSTTGAGDTMHGLLGDDKYRVYNSADQVFEAAGQGSDRIYASVSYNLAAGQEVEIMSTDSSAGTAAINLTGNELAQLIIGNAGNNQLSDGAAGAADTLQGLGGNDTYVVRNAGDIIVENAGQGTNDRVSAIVSFALAADDDIELMTTINANATTAINLTGNGLTQRLVGNDGVNTLNGGGAADIMEGNGGNDIYFVDNAGDTIVEKAGDGTGDRVRTSVSYTLTDTDNDIEQMDTTSSGGVTAIDLTGNKGAQTLIGNSGSNRLNGMDSNDTLRGYYGADTFVFSTGLGAGNIDTIFDMQVGADTIELASAIFAKLSPGVLAAGNFAANATGTATDGDDYILYNTATGGLYYDADANGAGAAIQFATLTGAPTITAGDFAIV